jgi:NSS family neurotransmitter:Na+ symporter
VVDTFVALLAGMAIFPAVFHFASVEGVAAESLKLEGVMLMFETLPKVFESLGTFGKIIEFVFFAMIIIAAVTSVISLLEVSSQFIIQKFKIKRKIATLSIALVTFIASIPIGISFGKMLNGSSAMQIFGMDYLSFLDTLTNTVFMPVCALFGCIAVGWFIGPKEIEASLEEENGKKSKFFKVIAFMIKYIVPILISIIEIFGLIGLLFVEGKFNLNGLGVVITALVILALAFLLYFALLKNKDTGTNEDEANL